MSSHTEQDARKQQEQEDRRRVIRMESKLTNLMSFLGVNHKEDVAVLRKDSVTVKGGVVHVDSPNTKITWIYDAMLEAGAPEAELYVAGVYRGRIVLN